LTLYYAGITETNKGCCGTGLFEVTPMCNELTPVCNDASKYVFWDSVHPTEATYKYIAKYLELEVLPKFQFHRDYIFDCSWEICIVKEYEIICSKNNVTLTKESINV
jgi:hypothetical protein